ncbi:PAS domain S-box protein [Clostridium aminobutyricum]|nr:PAS domain S-box protein [Clostridium aminobutyricum]
MNEKIVRSIIETLPMAYAYHQLILNSEGKPEDYIFIDANSSFEKMTGLKTENIVGKKVTEVLPAIKNDNFDWISFYGHVALTGEIKESTQYSAILNRWYNVTASSPEKGYFVAVFQDITEQVKTNNILINQKREIEHLYKDLEIIFNSTQDAMSLVKCEEDGFRYIRNNTVHQTRSGFNSQDIEGKTPSDVFGQEGKFVLENYQKCRDLVRTITYEHIFHFATGDRVWLTSITPVIQEGVVKYLVTSSKDVTELKKLQEEYEETLLRLQSMFNSHMAVMLIIEPQSGQILDANPAACDFYGYSKEEITRLNIQDINMLPNDRVRELRVAALEKSEGYFVFPHRLKSGEIKSVDVYSSPIPYDEKTVLFSIIFDVTDRENLKEELNRERKRLSITLRSIGDGVVTTDTQGLITSINQSGEEIIGWSEEEMKYNPFVSVFKLRKEQTGETVESPIAKVLKTGKIVSLENHTLLIHKTGKFVPIADSAAPIKNEDGEVLGVVMVFRDVSKDKKQQEQILFLSYNDALTGLYNRRYMEEEMKRLDTKEQMPLAVIMGDVNGLKLANDVFGHEQGDHLLRKIAEILKENCRENDVVARWGGDEFLIFLPKTKMETAQKIMSNIKKSCVKNSHGVVQLSLGMGCSVKMKKENLESVIQEAEERMYHQKLLEGRVLKKYMTNILMDTLYEKKLEDQERKRRIEQYCKEIGVHLKLSDAEMQELTLLAEAHNVGLLGIDQELLEKTEKLNAEEWEDVKRHAEIGYRIAQYTLKYSVVAENILAHHEHWDGSGYPRGIKEANIPLLSRILAVADAYDAMMHDRVYRKAMSKEEAIEELKRNAGIQFDPVIVDCFASVMG